ncbi:TPA: hypothetical protein DEG21_04660 [Patescibacteria group bacterium]|nr:hypothetical protein [Candidatus Gracilibacteria bacterium]HBY75125.1 hypothetical protein [Candidatus Gracilibacteria bacterium]
MLISQIFENTNLEIFQSLFKKIEAVSTFLIEKFILFPGVFPITSESLSESELYSSTIPIGLIEFQNDLLIFFHLSSRINQFR